MAEYSRLAHGRVLSTGGSTVVVLPFQPDWVSIVNFTAATTPTSGFVPFAMWDSEMGQGAAVYEAFNATPVLTTATTTTGGITTFSAGLALQFGPKVLITSITKSATIPLVTTAAPHGLVTGDVVVLESLYQTATTGMQQIASIPFYVTVTAPTTFTIQYDNSGSNFTALSAGGFASSQPFMKQVLYPALYAPGVANIAFITLGATTTIQTTQPHNYVVGQEVAFRIPSVYGTTQLNSLPNNLIPGSPIYGFVTSVTNANTFIVNINSTGFTAFNPNQTFASFPGLQMPQVVAVGDVNSGGTAYSGGALYPPPSFFNGTSASQVPTINGPAISGAFVNNTSQGFIIGATIAGAASDVLIWRAYLHDFSNP